MDKTQMVILIDVEKTFKKRKAFYNLKKNQSRN